MKNIVCSVAGVLGAGIAFLFGGWDASLITLLILMAMDYLTGIVVAGVFHNSAKTPSGTLESRTGLKGLIRKGMVLLIVIIAHRLDIVISTSYIRDAVCIAFIANEVLSIIENAGLMGVPIPRVITNAIEILKDRSDNGGKEEAK